jgi:integrase
MFLYPRKIYRKDPVTGRKIYSSQIWYIAWYETRLMPDGTTKSVLKSKSTHEKRKKDANMIMMKNYSKFKLNGSVFFSEFQRIFLQDYKTEVRSNTYKMYEGTIKQFLEVIPNKPLDLYSSHDILKYKQMRLDSNKKTDPKKKMSPASVNIELRNLHRIFNVAVKAKYILDNPCQGVRQEQIKKIPLSFSDEEIKLILENTSNTLLKRMIIFSLHTGCREAEVLNMKWSNIHLDEGYIEIVNTEKFKTKTSAERKIPINSELRELLKSLNISNITNIDGYIWGHLYDRAYISRSFKRVLRKLNFPEKYHWHCLRHTAISKWIKIGIPSSYVQGLAGHSSFITTLKYIHPDFKAIEDKLNIRYT